MMAISQPLLDLSDVTQHYYVRQGLRRREVSAVRGVSLTVRPGEVMGILGESGCGKTTLTRIMLGLLIPSSGTVKLAERPIESYSQLERARIIQPVFQDPYSSLNPTRSVLDIVAQPLIIHRMGTRAAMFERAEQVCGLVEISGRMLASRPSQLSGGQRQRVAIARALALEPRLLVCDEPTSALDVSVQAQVLNALLEIQKALNLAVVFVSHNVAVVDHFSTHVAVMNGGKIVETGVTASVLDNPSHPYTRTLLNSVLELPASSSSAASSISQGRSA